jgi:penicillin-insensitive murein DD-endopeptidase
MLEKGRFSACARYAAGFALALLLLSSLPLAEAGAETVHKLPSAFQQSPYSMMSLSVGYPNEGWQLRAKKLRKNRELRIKLGSADRAYGHPALVLMLKRSAHQVARGAPGSVMLVGDLSSREGGPLSGHTSHQSGRDADVGFYVLDARGRPAQLDHFVAFAADGRARDASGLVFDDWRNWLLLQAWAKDHRAGLSHIFVAAPLRQRLLGWAQARPAFRPFVSEVAALLKQPENTSPHDDHFHVRISCPKKLEKICREQSR